MKPITYINTATTCPYWDQKFHINCPRGYAYRQGAFNLHFYGHGHGLYGISPGLMAFQRAKAETIENWVQATFGAQEILTMQRDVGEVVTGVWRPGLSRFADIRQALNISEYEQRNAEQSLRILVEKLDEILLYIEPSPTGLGSYGHKTRELLILACTEVENSWVRYLSLANAAVARPSTQHYVKLHDPLHLAEYQIRFSLFDGLAPIRPFHGWLRNSPTSSLPWYDAYNKTKHDREAHFGEATLKNCLYALSAAIVMFCVRFSPIPLVEQLSTLGGLIRQHMIIELKDPDVTTFYVPSVTPESNWRAELTLTSADGFMSPFVQIPLRI